MAVGKENTQPFRSRRRGSATNSPADARTGRPTRAPPESARLRLRPRPIPWIEEADMRDDVRIEDGARPDALSLLMKGEALPAGTAWAGNPARPREGAGRPR